MLTLRSDHNFEVLSHYKNYNYYVNAPYIFQSEKNIDDCYKITLEIYKEQNLRRLHVDFTRHAYGMKRSIEHYEIENEEIYYVVFDVERLLVNWGNYNTSTTEYIDMFLKCAERLEQIQSDIDDK